jgi:uncharacterized protein (TIGR02679 family)
VSVDPGRARDLYGGPALAPLWVAARERLERRGSDARGRVTLRGLDTEQRRAVARLLGARLEPEGDVWIRLEDLDVALQHQALAASLPDVLEALGGRLVRRPSRQTVRAQAHAVVFGEIAEHPALARHPALAGWVDGLRARGRLAHLQPEDGRALLRAALDIAGRLPADGVPLPVLAGSAVGDTHALDRGTPLAVLVENALPIITATDTSDRRSLWAAAGVAIEGVSSSALVLNLRVRHERLGPLFSAAASAGEPLHVTLRMLRDIDVLCPDAALVSVCENRSVMEAAADRLDRTRSRWCACPASRRPRDADLSRRSPRVAPACATTATSTPMVSRSRTESSEDRWSRGASGRMTTSPRSPRPVHSIGSGVLPSVPTGIHN